MLFYRRCEVSCLTRVLCIQAKVPAVPARAIPARPPPNELAMLEGITTLHFRKSNPSAKPDSLSRVHPEGVGMGAQPANQSLVSRPKKLSMHLLPPLCMQSRQHAWCSSSLSLGLSNSTCAFRLSCGKSVSERVGRAVECDVTPH